jgi:hypothetical protein
MSEEWGDDYTERAYQLVAEWKAAITEQDSDVDIEQAVHMLWVEIGVDYPTVGRKLEDYFRWRLKVPVAKLVKD